MSSFLQELEHKLIEYALVMPETGKVEDRDFKVWRKGFCERMVRLVLRKHLHS